MSTPAPVELQTRAIVRWTGIGTGIELNGEREAVERVAVKNLSRTRRSSERGAAKSRSALVAAFREEHSLLIAAQKENEG